jgi:hypothetical protein
VDGEAFYQPFRSGTRAGKALNEEDPMSRRSTLVASVLVGLYLIDFVTTADGQPSVKPPEEGLYKVIEDIAKDASEKRLTTLVLQMRDIVRNRGRFLLDGSVVDEGGKPVLNVRFTYPKSRTLEEVEKRDIEFLRTDKARAGLEFDTRTIEGRFKIEASGFVSVELEFSCEGYYDQKVFVANDPTEEHMKDFWKQPKPGWIDIKKSLQVVMEKKGKITKLQEVKGLLTVTAKDGRTVLQFLPPEKPTRADSVTIQPGAEAKALPERFLEAKTDQEADGSIAIVQSKRTNSPLVDELPKSLKLAVAGPNSGFVKVAPKYGERPIPRQMKSAPEAGYTPELLLEREEIRSIVFNFRPVYFYFKAGTLYGRGSLTGWTIAPDRSKITAVVVLELQPDGTRNLETGE